MSGNVVVKGIPADVDFGLDKIVDNDVLNQGPQLGLTFAF